MYLLQRKLLPIITLILFIPVFMLYGCSSTPIVKTGDMGVPKSAAITQYPAQMTGLAVPSFQSRMMVSSFNTERYDHVTENSFLEVLANPLSTFSVDVDTASYANIRRFVLAGQTPPVDSVRIEEMINYFRYSYPEPKDNTPFAFSTELTDCPWNASNKLLLVGIQGKNVPLGNLPQANLVLLIDVSGSMYDSMPLLINSFKLMVHQLRPQDKLSIVVYSGRSGILLPPTSGSNKAAIFAALDSLRASGSTAGGQAIQDAYRLARENFVKGGNNRVIMATDGDFNVGVSSNSELVRLIEERRNDGVFLSVLGFGSGNLNDSMMRQLANSGNGNYNYIDSLLEARKVMVTQFGGTFMTIAKDVKLQVEFNPTKVQSYRLIGYEKRMLRPEDFRDDKKDAGDIGAGHTVTALYEIVPAGQSAKSTQELTYQSVKIKESATGRDELAMIRFRYKKPDGDTSLELQNSIPATSVPFAAASANMRLASSVAGWGMLLRNSPFKGNVSYTRLIQTMRSIPGDDADGYRAEFIKLLDLSCVRDSANCVPH